MNFSNRNWQGKPPVGACLITPGEQSGGQAGEQAGRRASRQAGEQAGVIKHAPTDVFLFWIYVSIAAFP